MPYLHQYGILISGLTSCKCLSNIVFQLSANTKPCSSIVAYFVYFIKHYLFNFTQILYIVLKRNVSILLIPYLLLVNCTCLYDIHLIRPKLENVEKRIIIHKNRTNHKQGFHSCFTDAEHKQDT